MHGPRFYIDYVVHFLTSHSRHGTHSPFVYRLVDEVIYGPRKAKEPVDKVEGLILRLVSRFGPRSVYTVGDPLPAHPVDFAVARGERDKGKAVQLEQLLDQLWPKLHTGSVFVLTGVYRTNRMKALWRTIQGRPGVTVTIDLFHMGLVFFHEGQAREDFRIRF